jgi:hypothetical protein
MASAESHKPTCPICNQSDQVKTTQTAYDSGVALAAPPDMPTKNISMQTYIIFSVVIVGMCSFLIIVLIGGMEENFGVVGASILAGVTLVCILTALVLSYIAFQRVVRGDAESTLRFPAWDRATEQWGKLYYCARDNVIFDPQTNKVLNTEQIAALRSTDEKEAAVQSASATH